MTYDAVVTFSFSISRQYAGKSNHTHYLAEFLGKLEDARVSLLSISGFASGRSFKSSCTPKSPTKFEAFLKSAKVRAKKTEAFKIGAPKQILGVAVFHKILASGYDIEAFDLFGISSRSGGFVWSDNKWQE